MNEVIPNAPTASNKARAGLSKEESVRFFGPPPVIAGEDRAQYEAMRDQISAAVGPLNFLEEISVNDIVNLVWETRRLRRLMVNLLNEDNGKVLTKALVLRIETVERVGRIIAGAEARRNGALRDIGVCAFADDPLREGFDVARQSGIEPDRHETRSAPTAPCRPPSSDRSWPAHWRDSPEFFGRSSRRLAFGQTGRDFLEFGVKGRVRSYRTRLIERAMPDPKVEAAAPARPTAAGSCAPTRSRHKCRSSWRRSPRPSQSS